MLFQPKELSMPRFAKVGAEFLIESHTRGVQRHPQLAALKGGFVTVWTDEVSPPCEIGGSEVRAKLFSAAGDTIRGEFLVNSETIDHQHDPRVASFPNGDFVVVWQDFSGRGGDACGGGIKAKLFSADGGLVRDELLVNVETYDTQFNANVAALADGAFVIAWQGYKGVDRDKGRGGVRARLFRRNGVPVGDEFLLSDCPAGRHNTPVVAGLVNGDFVAVWNDPSATPADAKGSSIKAKVFRPNGAVVREEFLVNTWTSNNQTPAAVAGLGDGGFVVVWTDDNSARSDVSRAGIKARLFDPLGEPRSDEFLISAAEFKGLNGAALASLSDGGFVVAWTACPGGGEASRSAIKAQVFGPQGSFIGEEVSFDTEAGRSQSNPAVTGLAGGGFVVAWEDAGAQEAAGGVSVKAQIFRSSR